MKIISLLLLIAGIYCEGHVIKKRQEPSTTPDCLSYLKSKCQKLLDESMSSVCANATDENAYAQNLCSKAQKGLLCLEGLDWSTCPSFSSVLDKVRLEFYSSCHYEGTCRLAEPSFCIGQVAELPTFYEDICPNVQSVTSCVEESLSRRGCTSRNTATRFWAYQMINLELYCFILPWSPNPPPCNLPYTELNQCMEAFSLALPSILTGDFSKICGEFGPMKSCLRGLSVECNEAKVLIEKIISHLDDVVYGACTPPHCISHGNVYSVVPNTHCTMFTQSVGGYVAGTFTCPLGTLFDTDVCVCNHSYRVQCII